MQKAESRKFTSFRKKPFYMHALVSVYGSKRSQRYVNPLQSTAFECKTQLWKGGEPTSAWPELQCTLRHADRIEELQIEH